MAKHSAKQTNTSIKAKAMKTFLLFVCVSILTVIALVQTTFAKYVIKKELVVGVATADYYFTATAEEEEYISKDGINAVIKLGNSEEEKYTEVDIEYTVVATNEDYEITIEDATNGVIEGGSKKEQEIIIKALAKENAELERIETIVVEIKTSKPYVETKTIELKIDTKLRYAVTYDANGGENAPEAQEKIEDEDLELSNTIPTRRGYTFKGWATTAEATEAEYTIGEDGKVSPLYSNNEELTLYAVWAAEEYTITYNLNDGTVAGTGTNPSTYTIESKNITLINPSKDGYTFAGWTGANGAIPELEVIIEKGSTGNKIYTANWELTKYTITYELNGGTEETNPTEYTIESRDITLVQPTKTGYTFAGWTGANGETAQTQVTIATGSTGDRTYTANWELIKYTIEYDLAGGTIEGINPETYTVVTEDITLINPGKDGYVFEGWTGTDLDEVTQTVTIAKGSTGNRTYKANFVEDSYTVTYNYAENGGTSSTVETASVEYNSAVNLTPKATKDGYTFVGWNTDKDATTALASLTMGKEDLTLYAIYKKDITLTFIDYKGTTKTTTTQKVTIYNNDAGTTKAPEINTYTGWTAKYWTTAITPIAAEEAKNGGEITEIRANRTYYAIYESTLTATFIDYTGENLVQGIRTVNSNSVAPANISNPIITTPKVGIYEGWTGLGWATATGTTAAIALAEEESITITNNPTYYARYEQEVTISFVDLNGEEQQTRTVSGIRNCNAYNVASILNPTITSPAISTYTGWTSIGWTKSQEIVTTYDLSSGGRISNVTEDATYYATYKKQVVIGFTDYYDADSTSATSWEKGRRTVSGYRYVNAYDKENINNPTATVPSVRTYGNWIIDGWTESTEPTGEIVYTGGETIVLIENKEYYAIYHTNYTAKFIDYVDGAQSTREVISTRTINAYDTSVNHNPQVQIPELREYEGWKVLGWSTSSNYNGAITYTGGEYITLTSNPTYYARYEQEVTITFIDLNGEEQQTRTVSGIRNCNAYNVASILNPTITSPTITAYSNWTTLGWTKSQETVTTYDLSSGGRISNVTEDATYYAVYYKNEKYTFTYYGEYQSYVGTDSSGNPKYETKIGTRSAGTLSGNRYLNAYNKENIKNPTGTIPAKPASYSDWVFMGWTDEEVPEAEYDYVGGETNIEITSTKAFYALYDDLITVNFKYYNNQTEAVKGYVRLNTKDVSNKIPTEIKAPGELGTQEGYRFRGWSTANTGNAEINLAANESITLSANATYYASYEYTVTVTYNPNGGTGEAITATGKAYMGYTGTKTAASITMPENTYTKVGYTFTNWYTAATSGSARKVGTAYNYSADTTLYARWTVNTYKVTYNYAENGGTTATSTTASVAYEGAISLSPTATKDGYTFVGWNTDKDATTKLESLTMGLEDVTLYAIYTKTITATFYYYNNKTTTVSDTIYNKVKEVTLQAPGELGAQEGQRFRGWSTTNTGNAEINLAANESVTLSANATYYASYEYTVTVTYNPNGGTGGTITATGTAYMGYTGTKTAASITMPENTYIKVGYTFTNWYTAATSGSVRRVGRAYSYTEDTTLYARWTVNTYTVTYNYAENGGTTATETTATVAYEGAISLASTATKDGYTFVGWNTDKDATTKLESLTMGLEDVTLYAIYTKTITATFYYYNNKTITVSDTIYNKVSEVTLKAPEALGTPEGYTFRGWSTVTSQTADINLAANESVTLSANATYYASYTYPVTITYDANGGTGGTITATGTAYMGYTGTKTAASITMPENTYIKVGYTFANWYTAATSGSVRRVGRAYSYTEDTTLYARWTAKTYTITYDLNGGSATIGNQTKTHDTDITLSTTVPTRTGYTFLGWSRDKNATTATYIAGAKYSEEGEATLYAVWKANEYAITYDKGDSTGENLPTEQTATYDKEITLADNNMEKADTATGYTITYKQGTASTTTNKPATQRQTISYIANGWATSSNGTRAYESGASFKYTLTNGLKLYPSWSSVANTVVLAENTMSRTTVTGATVTFNYNGSGAANTTATVQTTYAPDGWATSSSGTKAYGSRDEITPTGNIVLYPYFVPTVVSPEFPTPTRTGYTFDGWYTAASGGTKVTEYTGTTNVTYYAHWTANSYEVNYLSGNLLYGLEDKEETETWGMTYSISNGVVTVTAKQNDGGGYTTGRVYLEAGKTYLFECKSTGTWGTKTQAYLMPNGQESGHCYMNSTNYTFTPSVTDVYWLRLDVEISGETYEFSNIKIYEKVQTETKEYSSELGTLPEIVRAGYTLVGWFEGEDGTGIQISSTTTVPAADTTYYAHWTMDTYTISYDLAGGSVATANPTSYNVATEDITLVNPTRTGYTFAGWTGTDLSEATTAVTIPKGSTGARTYTATWTANTYTLTYNTNYNLLTNGDFSNGTNGWDKNSNGIYAVDQTVKYNGLNSMKISSQAGTTSYDGIIQKEIPVKANTKYKLSLAAYSDGNVAKNMNIHTQQLKDGEYLNPYLCMSYTSSMETNTWVYKERYFTTSDDVEGFVVTCTFAKTSEASHIWLANLRLEEVVQETKAYGTALGTLPTPTREGYTLNGWYTARSGGTKISSTTTMPAAGTSYYAQWTMDTYTISYNLAGGTVGTANPTTYTITSNAITLNNPTREGYIFTGWTGTGLSAATTTVTIPKGSTGNRTYTANWQQIITYTVNYYRGSTLLGSSTHEGGKEQALTAIETLGATLSGYTFAGWATTSTSTARTYADGEIVNNLTTTANGTVNLYSVWQRTATFYSGINKATTETGILYRNNTSYSITMPSTIAEISGWTIEGWRNDTTAGAKEYSAGATATGSSSVAYYAVYSREVKLTYNGNGATSGSVGNQTGTQYYNSYSSTQVSTVSFTLQANGFTKTGSTFSKWAAGSTSGSQYAAGSSYSYKPARDATTTTQTMYAIWSLPAAGTITFTNGPSITTACSGGGSDSESTSATVPAGCRITFSVNGGGTNGGGGGSVSFNGSVIGTSNVTNGVYDTTTSGTLTMNISCGSGPGGSGGASGTIVSIVRISDGAAYTLK